MVDLVNPLMALVSICLGAIGWFAPRWTMEVIDLQRGSSTMGVSEVRAVSGALFVGLGIGALWIGQPAAYLTLGFGWAFAALGRLTSALFDEAPIRKTWGFFACEAVVGAALVLTNIGSL